MVASLRHGSKHRWACFLLIFAALASSIQPNFQLFCEGAPNSISVYRIGQCGSVLIVQDYPRYGLTLPFVRLVPVDEAATASLFRLFWDVNQGASNTGQKFQATDDDSWTVEWSSNSKHFHVHTQVSEQNSPVNNLATQLLKIAKLTHRYDPPV
jgi:hypothetical protein